MKSMPFIEQLQHWAKVRGGHAAVVVGGQKISFGALLEAAATAVAPTGSTSVIDAPAGVGLATEFCAALLHGRTAMVLDGGWPEALRARLRGAARDWAAGHAANPDGTPKAADAALQPFLLGLSSGTSGLPKAFTRTAESWRESFVRSTEYFRVGTDTVTLAPGPMAASMNLYALGESLHAGGTFVGLPDFSPDAALAAAAANQVNRLVLVPTILELLARRGLATGRPAPAITGIVCAGAALTRTTADLARRWAPNATIQMYYGAAELGFVSAASVGPDTGQEAATKADDGAGRAFPGVALSIRDGQGRELPAGEVGSVCVKSPYVCSGYAWGDDGLAFSALGPSGWYTVHDQGSLDARGILHLAGRASDMILCSGANVYPHAVEQALLAVGAGRAAVAPAPTAPEPAAPEASAGSAPAALDIMVAGIPDPVRGQSVIAAFRQGDGGTRHHPAAAGGTEGAATAAALRLGAAVLPPSHRPSRYYELSELPLTGSGKISRTLLAQWIVEGDPRAQRRH